MKSRLLQILFAVTLVLAGYWWGHSSVTVVHAQSRVNIPKAFGRIIGTPAGFLVLEDASGMIRIVEATNGTVDAIVTRN